MWYKAHTHSNCCHCSLCESIWFGNFPLALHHRLSHMIERKSCIWSLLFRNWLSTKHWIFYLLRLSMAHFLITGSLKRSFNMPYLLHDVISCPTELTKGKKWPTHAMVPYLSKTSGCIGPVFDHPACSLPPPQSSVAALFHISPQGRAWRTNLPAFHEPRNNGRGLTTRRQQ